MQLVLTLTKNRERNNGQMSKNNFTSICSEEHKNIERWKKCISRQPTKTAFLFTCFDFDGDLHTRRRQKNG